MACRGGEFNFSSFSSHFPSSQFPAIQRKGLLFYTAAVLETKCRGRGGHQQRCTITCPNTTRRRTEFTRIPIAELSEQSNKKIANLSATRKERVMLPNYDDGCWRMYPIGEFLSHPSGVEAILNTRALQSFESLAFNTYRCILPKIQLLKFEVAPVLDLRVSPTGEDCIVEMLSCKFEGSKAVQRQNNHFSAFMRNHIKWDTNGPEPSLDVDVKLNLALEIYTLPFKMLPISAVENPGNLIIQALVDRLVPMLLQQLLQDYEKWVKEQRELSSLRHPHGGRLTSKS